MAKTGEERLRELRLAVEAQNAELKQEIDSKATESRLSSGGYAAVDKDEEAREERKALRRKKRLEEATRENGTWSYGWIAAIIFGCAAVAVLVCLVLFGGTPAKARLAKMMAMKEEQEWENQVEETYGGLSCPRPDNFPIECKGRKWLSNRDRCTSLFIYRGWDIDFLQTCNLISGEA
uniref:Uncharacterized protein n=1 Tax=Tetraselmis sp. GSL018 TaxID=582737 RepID=A0A061R2W1_9CHLO|mmetsp:Transcript_38110/g.90548  ORF Transcript_38110/g.90548 Transcript_38110/m.90548 type:complete len:178 (+) Transcript_38110:217-750(+)|eukprot:CAMPEP_0177606460 /NCGR_PEP_ID=MMETSP0419_2-20121207/17320_1 /TAXON_ID=582737 /ORGANISM="Tetraselmis sp., Strain GSL018" /LENGTH=177 /DNA_ID=CAMNT_0019100825 /DNA_START=214 /DNA_END=747 /DNA_ORIENTATION=+